MPLIRRCLCSLMAVLVVLIQGLGVCHCPAAGEDTHGAAAHVHTGHFLPRGGEFSSPGEEAGAPSAPRGHDDVVYLPDVMMLAAPSPRGPSQVSPLPLDVPPLPHPSRGPVAGPPRSPRALPPSPGWFGRPIILQTLALLI